MHDDVSQMMSMMSMMAMMARRIGMCLSSYRFHPAAGGGLLLAKPGCSQWGFESVEFALALG